MDVNQSSGAFAGAAPFASQLAQEAQRSVQDERDSVQRAAGDSAAVDTTEAADVRADAPVDDDGVEAASPPPVAEADDSERAAPESERERGAVVDLTV